jgi:gas vesicle protein
MGYFRGLRHGALIGAALALLYAPDAGVVTRRRLAGWLGQVQGGLAAGSADPAGSRTARPRSSSGRAVSPPKRQAAGE